MSERVALYAATRNLYDDMVVSAKSLLANNGADKIYFLIEDESFPHDLPSCIHPVDVSNQTIFPPSGPNFTCRWTYMALIRVALSRLFTGLDKILTLDVDTITHKPIDYLWNLDLSNYYFAMVEEQQIRHRQHPYFNFGVCMQNLAKLRDGADNVIITTINTTWLNYPEQDAVNSVCRRHIFNLPPEYNAMWFNIPPVPDDDVCIKHYANKFIPFSMNEDYKHYAALSWDDVFNLQSQLKGS